MGSPAGEDNNNDNDNNNEADKKYVVLCEISPLVSYAGENLQSYKGKRLQLPVHLE